MSTELPPPVPGVTPEPKPQPVEMRAFARDQVQAVAILRDEKFEETANRRMDACHLAMRYLDTFQSGHQHTTRKVIETARVFERYLLEP